MEACAVELIRHANDWFRRLTESDVEIGRFRFCPPNRTFFRRQKPFAIAQGDGADEGRRVIAASPEGSENSVFTRSRETESGSSGVSGGS
jgi:hypothetical protein